MVTPYSRASAPADQQVRPVLTRPTSGRIVAGVCAGVAEHLGLEAKWVRLLVVLLTFANGVGIVFYGFLWALTPASDDPRLDPAVPGPPLPGQPPPGPPPSGPLPGPQLPGQPPPASERTGLGPEALPRRLLLGGAALLVAGTVWLAQEFGFDVRANVLLPLLVICIGAVIAWSQLDDAQRGKWLGRDTGTRGLRLTRLAFGFILAVIGLVVLVTRGRSLPAVWDSALATLAVLAGAVLIAAPWAVRLWTELRHEQEESARARERADIAAHLHDSVLQTLALIQRQAGDPVAVNQLARAQERELRSWLYAGPVGSTKALASAAAEAAHDVEDLHGIPIDLVVTGDGPLDAHGQALVRALRESLLNAVRHGRPPVSAYVEIGPRGVEAFVRDHGDGFDLEDIPGDRLGVRESILGRMSRHGGTARVRRMDQGTEIELVLPGGAAAGAVGGVAGGAAGAPAGGPAEGAAEGPVEGVVAEPVAEPVAGPVSGSARAEGES
jgi:signal transduction histidine kinase/phage shock protein PspC (stress-responsive transcriptional regulator)